MLLAVLLAALLVVVVLLLNRVPVLPNRRDLVLAHPAQDPAHVEVLLVKGCVQ